VLSGGEKSRVALARILLQASNLLVMDEPTNHLDMRSKEMLIDSLENYDGTLLLVSHDRYFLDSLVNKVVAIKNGSLQLYLGTYAEYLEKSEQEHEEEKRLEAAALKAKAAAAKAPEAKKPTGQAKAKKNKDSKKIAAIEQEINRLEQEKERMETLMATEDFYRKSQNETAKVLEEYHGLSAKLEKLFADWETAGG